jgi:sugar/nucleoside kinase (ribokinase family)
MHIVTVGDVMLDVLVEAPSPLRPDDDIDASITLASGGQAANVAVWAVALGAEATVIGPRGDSEASRVVASRLAAAGVGYGGIDAGDVGTVVSIVAAGTRTMASDAGPQRWLNAIGQPGLPKTADWLHVSGYPLLRAADPSPLTALAASAADGGASISVDLASAAMIGGYGAARFAAAVAALEPDVVFATRSEWDRISPHWRGNRATIVVKEGPAGATVITDGVETRREASSASAVDATGAGDALAAGFLVGGIDLAMETAARCVARLGAQP